VVQVQSGRSDDTPEPLKRSPGLRAIYNTLSGATSITPATHVREERTTYGVNEADPMLDYAQQIDAALRQRAPHGWRGVLPKEQEVKRLIYEVVKDTALVERLFPVIKVQAEY
jgi:type I restriction enzyme R subunit